MPHHHRPIVAALALALAACSGDGGTPSPAPGSPSQGTPETPGTPGTPGAPGTPGTPGTPDAGPGTPDAGGGVNPGTGSPTGCLAGDLLQQLGKDRLLIGVNAPGDTGDAVAAKAKFTLRYRYLAAGLCKSCSDACADAWWGCWQDKSQPPGAYVRDFLAKAKASVPAQLPMISYYELLQSTGVAEGEPEVDAVANAALLRPLLDDWRFLLQQVGSERALLQFEPDFWGYTQNAARTRGLTSPSQLPAAVTSANPTDCASFQNSVGGLGKCVVAMVRRYAPNAKVSLHASAWATGNDSLRNGSAAFDVEGEARKVADWLLACGGAEADFVTLDPLDRDAGFYEVVQHENRWWDASDKTLPNFAQAFRWAKALSERMQKPNLWWQIPVGNMGLPNTNQAYKDNRVEVLFSRTADVAKAHGFGLAFGAGEDRQTNPDTDKGVLYGRTNALHTAGGQPPCP